MFSLKAAAQDVTAAGESTEVLYRNALEAIAQGDSYRAQQLLKQMTQSHPAHMGAWMDAALLWCQMGEAAKADAIWNALAQRFDLPAGIAAFIRRQRQQGCVAPVPQSAAYWHSELARGHTSNVNQGPRSLQVQLPTADGPVLVQLLPGAAARAETYTQLEAGVENLPLSGPWRAHANWQWRRHDSVRSMDMQTLFAGVGRSWRLKNWDGRTSTSVGLAWLDNQLYQNSVQLHSEATPPWQPGGMWRWHMSANVQWLKYPTLKNFDATRWEVNGHWSHHTPRSRWQASLGTMSDLGVAQRPGGNRRGWQAGVQWHAVIGHWREQPLIARAQWQWQRWGGSRVYSPGIMDVVRTQRTHTAAAALMWLPDPRNTWVAEVRHIRNDENIALFAYDMTQFQISWRHQWQPAAQ